MSGQGEETSLERNRISGLGLLGLVTIVASACSRTPVSSEQASERPASAKLTLAQVSPQDRRAIDYAALDARLKRLAEARAVVGLAVGVVESGRITFLSGYGETVAGSGDMVTPDTVFRWASVSKGVAATMVAKLVEQGKVDFNTPVVNYSSSLKLPAAAEYRATVGDLLSHRLGIYRNAYDNKLEEGQDSSFLRATLNQLTPICPPGSCWSYQNVAYDGSSEVVQKVAGQPYQNVVKQSLFDPIGMTSATMTREGLVTARSWARPHNGGERPLEVHDTYYRVPAAGGVNSNIKDLALWMIAQMGAMPDVLSPRLLETIHAPLVRTPGESRRMRKFLERVKDPYYGYGWRSYDYSGHRIIGHHGGVSGYRALILFDPEKKGGVVALWNSNTSQPNGLEFEVMDMLYGLPFRDWLGLDSSGAPAAPSEPSEDADDAETSTIAEQAQSRDRRRGT